jgi:hypothetical protein
VSSPDALAAPVELTLPVLTAPAGQPAPSGAEFAWLHAIDDDSGSFLGYIRSAARFDARRNTVTIRLPMAQLQGTLFLPARLSPAWVANHDPSVHIWSGPAGGAVDFGFAGRQFTTFSVVAPQVGPRFFVYNPVTDNYGWIDAPGVGPVGPPGR